MLTFNFDYFLGLFPRLATAIPYTAEVIVGSILLCLIVGMIIAVIRIAAAKEMLEQGDLKVYEIAEKLGYESAFYFSKVFKKVTGLSPREYQQSI